MQFIKKYYYNLQPTLQNDYFYFVLFREYEAHNTNCQNSLVRFLNLFSKTPKSNPIILHRLRRRPLSSQRRTFRRLLVLIRTNLTRNRENPHFSLHFEEDDKTAIGSLLGYAVGCFLATRHTTPLIPGSASTPPRFRKMEDSSLLSKLMLSLRASCKYYTGFPKDLGPSRVMHFTSEREFVQLLHQGYPVVVAFTIKCNLTKHLDKVLEEAGAEFYPHVKFMRVECPKYPGFCLARQKKEYPFIEIFHSPEQATSQGKAVDPNVTKYAVKVLPFNHDPSAYGFREFFKQRGIRSSD